MSAEGTLERLPTRAFPAKTVSRVCILLAGFISILTTVRFLPAQRTTAALSQEVSFDAAVM